MNEKSEYEFIIARSDSDYLNAKALFREYAESLDINLCFQDFDTELNEINIQYSAPTGGLILIKKDNLFIGCAGIRKLVKGVAELKRMYIIPHYRGLGLGKILLEKAIELARKIGYRKIRLDTMTTMKAAVNLYTRYGFKEINPYRFNPSPEVLYLEKDI